MSRFKRFDLVDAGGDQAVNDISFEIEVRLARRSVDEEAGIVGIVREEAIAECLVDFVGGLADARPDGGMDIRRAARRGAPSPSMVESVTPASAPRQPAWAAPTTPAS